jgi:DNA-binding transcriptional LysR family regulator
MPLPPTFPELAALDVFRSVVALGSLSRAAAAHGITQPSVSARMKALERQMGVVLLARGPTGSVPTDNGRLVAGWAESVLRAADELAAGVGALRDRSGGRLRLVASYTVAEYLLPGWLDRFHRLHPDNPVELDVANSSEVVERVRGGRTELGFIESPGPVTGLRTAVVERDELVAVVRPGHAWSRHRVVDAERVASTPLVLREPGSGTRESLETALADAGLEPPMAVLELGSTSAVKAAVISGGSPAVLSRLAVEADAAGGRLRIVPIVGMRLSRELRAVWRRDRALPPQAATLLEELRD